MRLVLVTPSAASVVTLTEAKAQARVDHCDEDLLIQHYTDAATAWLDGPAGILGRCLVTQSWRAELARLTGPVRLRFPDSVIDNAMFTDEIGGELPYELSGVYQHPVLIPQLGIGRPAAITFTAGYGMPEQVPAAIRQAILLLVAAWYDHRATPADTSATPIAVDALIAPFRRQRL